MALNQHETKQLQDVAEVLKKVSEGAILTPKTAHNMYLIVNAIVGMKGYYEK